MAFLRALLILMCLGAMPSTVDAHPCHASLCEMEWNARSQRFEVAMKLRIVDLEDAIGARQGTKFRIEHSPDVKQSIQEYLRQHFAITFDGHQATRLHWVGLELELHDVWIYFEAESTPGVDSDIPAPSLAGAHPTDRKLSWDELIAAPVAGDHVSGRIPAPASAVLIRNSLLTDSQPEQINLVVLTFARRVVSTTFSLKVPETRLALQ